MLPGKRMDAIKRVMEIDFLECDLIGYNGRPLRYPGNDKAIRLSRAAADWRVSGAYASNVNRIEFPECRKCDGTFHAVGAAIYAVAGGKYRVIGEFELTMPLTIIAGITPVFMPGQLRVDVGRL